MYSGLKIELTLVQVGKPPRDLSFEIHYLQGRVITRLEEFLPHDQLGF